MINKTILFTALIVLITGCAAPGGFEAQDSKLPTPATRTQVPIETPKARIDFDQEALHGVTINLWNGWDGVTGSLLEQMASEFNLRNEYGIRIIVTPYGNLDKLKIAISNTDLEHSPDMIIALPEEILAMENKLVDIQPFASDAMIGIEGINIPEVFLQQSRVGNKQLGYPMGRSARVLFYNDSFAKDLGFSTPPSSLTDFEEQICAANQYWKTDKDLTNDGFGGFVLDTDTNWQSPLGWIESNDPTFNGTQTLFFNNGQNIKLFSKFADFRTNGCVWLPGDSNNFDNLISRRALISSGDLLEITDQNNAKLGTDRSDTWQVIPFPGTQPTIITYGVDYGISKTDPNKEIAAWLFIKWMLQTENQSRWSTESGFLPLTQASIDRAKTNAIFSEQYSQVLDLLPQAVGYPITAQWAIARNLLADGYFQSTRSFPYYTSDMMLQDIDAQYLDLSK